MTVNKNVVVDDDNDNNGFPLWCKNNRSKYKVYFAIILSIQCVAFIITAGIYRGPRHVQGGPKQ